MLSLYWLVQTVLEIYIWVLIAYVILSWLTAFRVINTHNAFVRAVSEFLYRATEPALRPIRRVLPTLGGLDLSPLVLILIVYFVRSLLWEYWGRTLVA